MPYNVASESL